jgi:hypothetical protein
VVNEKGQVTKQNTVKVRRYLRDGNWLCPGWVNKRLVHFPNYLSSASSQIIGSCFFSQDSGAKISKTLIEAGIDERIERYGFFRRWTAARRRRSELKSVQRN